MSGTSPPRAMSQIVLRLCSDCGVLLVGRPNRYQCGLGHNGCVVGCPSLILASCASPQRRQELVGSWAERTLDVSSIDMSFAPPLIVAQVYNLDNSHWVLRLLLIAPTRECLCLKFDPLV